MFVAAAVGAARLVASHAQPVDLEIDRVDRSSRSIFSPVESIDRVDSSRVDRSSEREVESVDNIDSKSTFGSDADSTEHGEQ